jgi:hypothetical protein
MKSLKLTFLFFACTILMAYPQEEFTPYDDIPGLIKNYKPAYDPNYPEWAKKLYQFPVNYHQAREEFNAYMKDHAGEKSPVIRYFKLWSRAVEPFVDSNGEIRLPDNDQYYQNLKSAQLNSGKQLKSGSVYRSDWSFLGPKETFWLNEEGSSTAPGACPWQANVYSFDVAPNNNSILYCGTETGFVNKTTDKGFTWKQLGLTYPFGGGVTAIAIHPTNPDIVYVSAGKQIHKTVDGGVSWTPMLGASSFSADRLKIDPNNPEKLIAAAKEGIFVTTNGGATWANPWTLQTWDVELKPDDSNVIYGISKDSGNLFKIVQSTNGGASFSTVSSFPSNKNQSGGLLAVTPANPSLLYASLLSSEGTESIPFIVKGTSSGDQWSWVQTKRGEYSSTGGLGGFTNGQGYFDLVFEISPTNEKILFFGTCTLWKSTDGGYTYTAVGGYKGNFSIHPDQQDLKILPSGETWLATDGGLTLSTDYFTGTSNAFVRINGLIGSDMWGFDQGWNEDIVVGGRYHNGNTAIADFYQSKALRMGGAESPTGWVLLGKSRHVAFNDLGNGWILPKTATGKPEGRFIFSKYPTMDEYGGRLGNIVHHPNYFGTLFLGEGKAIWKSIDSGVSYDLLYSFPDKIRYLQISNTNAEVIYADIDNYGLYKTTDGGKTWMLKSSLTSEGGRSSWKGRLFFVISPSNEKVIYACYQNGQWSANRGSILRSVDGGETWQDWTGSTTGYTKCLVIQPSETGADVVYLFTNSKNGESALTYVRSTEMSDWELFVANYPSGMSVHKALPFYRDSKIRVSGNAGIWESPMAVQDFQPVVNPWVEKQSYNCLSDTVFFDDHSILNHKDASWKWEISPVPAFISNENIRNPKVVLGKEGSYSVKLTVTQNGKSYSKTISNMVTTTTCPSLTNCSNPAELPQKEWSLIYADSEEKNYPGLATMAFDSNPSTIWHTRWSNGTDYHPHEIQIDLGKAYNLHKFTYLGRSDGPNGRVKEYELYVSNDKTNWGSAIASGEFTNTAAPQNVSFVNAPSGRYFRLKALSEVNGGAWTSAAELSLIGCYATPTGINPMEADSKISAFPVPANDRVSLSLPSASVFRYGIYSTSGQLIEQGQIEPGQTTSTFDLQKYQAGIYVISLTDQLGTAFRVKIIKK